jgi:hypothetical protein
MKTKVISFAVMMLLSTSSLLTQAKPATAIQGGELLSLGANCVYNKQCNSNCCIANECSGNCKASFFKVSYIIASYWLNICCFK